jgi:hypothetical protein
MFQVDLSFFRSIFVKAFLRTKILLKDKSTSNPTETLCQLSMAQNNKKRGALRNNDDPS